MKSRLAILFLTLLALAAAPNIVVEANQTPAKKPTRTHNLIAAALACALAVTITHAQTPPQSKSTPPASTPAANQQAPSIHERVAALKKSLAESMAALKGYEWIETTVVSLKGEEKATTEKRCYYGADGKVQKITIEAPPEPKKKPGIRGAIIEKKKGEITAYMKQAAELVHQYVPPDPEAIQKAKDAGNVSVAVLEPGKRVRLDMKDFLMPGDLLKVEINSADNRLSAIGVSTFLNEENSKSDKKDQVTLEVRMGTLEDGTSYSAQSTLEAKAKEMKVVVTNSGYRKIDK